MRTPLVMIVDDFEPFRRFLSAILQSKLGLEVIHEASSGVEAVEKAQALQPDLILLDIGLPKLNGIEAAKRIRKVSPESKVLFVSQEQSAEVVQEVFSMGARGYVLKVDVGIDLLNAVDAVLRGEQFVGRRFAGQDFVGAALDSKANRSSLQLRQNVKTSSRHDVGFYSDDASLLNDLTQFVRAALDAGSVAVVVATESHRDSLLLRLRTRDLDIGAAIEEGRYITLDAAETLSTFMVNGMPDAIRFLKLLGSLIATAAQAAKGEHARIAIFGECAQLLWAQGNEDAAIQLEKLGNQLAEQYDIDILCGYSLGSVHGDMESHTFQKICAEHSAVRSQ